MKKAESKRCKYCQKTFYKKDFKKNFNRMITCGSPDCIKKYRTEWVYNKKCPICGKKITRTAKLCEVCSVTGDRNPFYNKTHTEEAKKKMNLFNKGDVSHMKGKKHKAESIEKNRKKHLGKKLTKETIRKILGRREMSSLEVKMNDLIRKLNLPYLFVGDGSFLIEKKNPDFININGDKIAIEVYYRKHKELFGQAKGIGIEQWKKERSAIFKKYGWKIMFFDEIQVNENELMDLIQYREKRNLQRLLK